MAASVITLFANNPSTTVAVNGYNGGSSTAGTPASGTSETWTVTSSTGFPTASNTTVPPSQFCIADLAAPTEIIWVTNISGTTWTVIRGQEGSTTVTHAAGATFTQIVSAGDLTSMKQATGAIVAPVTVVNTATETVLCSYQPVAGEVVAGTTFELVATGTIRAATSTASAMKFTLRWGGVAGTTLLSVANGTNGCSAFSTGMSTSGLAFDVNGTVTFISTTSAIANLNFWFQQNTTTGCGTGVASSGTATTGLTAPPGGGPLVLTAKWTAASTNNSLVVPGPVAYRAA